MKKWNCSIMLLLPALCGAGAAHAQPPTAVTPEFVMANNDLNKDGIITREEADKAGRQLAQNWDTFDLNKDGKVDTGELTQALAGLSAPVPPPSAAGPPAPTPPPTR